jgi:hypothetical protein
MTRADQDAYHEEAPAGSCQTRPTGVFSYAGCMENREDKDTPALYGRVYGAYSAWDEV